MKKETQQLTGKDWIIGISFFILIGFIMSKCTASTPPFDIDGYDNYSIVKTNDFSYPGRTRLGIYIKLNDTNNITQEKLYKTVTHAAFTYQKETNANLVSSYVVVSDKKTLINPVAMADYSPDLGGISGTDNIEWKITATKNYPTPTQVKISEEWYKMRDDFLEPVPNFPNMTMPNEDKLKKAIAKKLNIPLKEEKTEFGTYLNLNMFMEIPDTILEK